MDNNGKNERKDEQHLQHQLEEIEEFDREQEQEKLVRENKMGTMPIMPLLLNVSVPIVISMLVQALYNVVDSIFVARLGEEALASVGLIFPVQNLMIAVAAGTGVGINSLLSRRLGERDVEGANRVARHGVLLAVISWVAFAIAAVFATKPFVAAFTGSNAASPMAAMAESYMYIVCIGSFGVFMAITMERLLMSTGRSMYAMTSQLVGAVINIILDPIMIFGLLGFPAMGVAGAALATVIGQLGSVAVGVWANLAKNPEISLNFRGFRPNGKTIKHIYQVGLPGIIMQSIGSVMTFGMNKILVGFGTTALSVFNIYFKLQSFIYMPVFGLNNGMIPIVAFNYGAKKPARIAKTVKYSSLLNFSIMVVGVILFWAIPGPLLALFDASESMTAMGIAALRIISISFPFAAFAITFSGVFQALGNGVYSLIMSLVRQLIFLLPIAWALSRAMGMPALWAAFPLAEVSSIILAVYFLNRLWREKIRPLERAGG